MGGIEPATPSNLNCPHATNRRGLAWRPRTRLGTKLGNGNAMNLGQLHISRRTATIAVAFVGLVSLAIGAHAALNKRSLDVAKAIGTEQTGSIGTGANRVALVIGNGHYPDATFLKWSTPEVDQHGSASPAPPSAGQGSFKATHHRLMTAASQAK